MFSWSLCSLIGLGIPVKIMEDNGRSAYPHIPHFPFFLWALTKHWVILHNTCHLWSNCDVEKINASCGDYPGSAGSLSYAYSTIRFIFLTHIKVFEKNIIPVVVYTVGNKKGYPEWFLIRILSIQCFTNLFLKSFRR